MVAKKSEKINGTMLTHTKDVGIEVFQSKRIQFEMGDSYEKNGKFQNGFYKFNIAL
jgi:hypothetical protein